MTNAQMRYDELASWLEAHHYDGFLLPVTDEYQGEYSAEYARRVTWLTRFDGSAGMLVFIPQKAALLVDGRYTLQAANEVDAALYAVHNSASVSASDYIRETLHKGAVIAYDPWLHSVEQIDALHEKLDGWVTLCATQENPIDTIWKEQPSRPKAVVVKHADALAGRTAEEKFADLRSKMRTDALLVTEPDAICWLLNIRGDDVPYNPLPLCYAICYQRGTIDLIINPQKVKQGLLPNMVHIVDEEEIHRHIKYLDCEVIGYDAKVAPVWFLHQFQQAGIHAERVVNPITLMKAVKNNTEIANMRRAHEVDGKAVTKFLQWFDHLEDDTKITELDVVAQLEHFRRQHKDYIQPSFSTIAGAGEHGAIVHYRADEKSNRAVNVGDALLVDSGGQYEYGTTDITRTMFRGEPSADFKQHYTLVLKGHIALARAQFPKGTTGSQLDILARQFLWAEGLDYKHGTGHGVGHYLCVHEGPQGISTRANNVALQPGMILSNEPGYYKEGEYGIRIESLVLVVEKGEMDGQLFYGFETLTKAPIDARLVDEALMSDAEMAWMKAYHDSLIEKSK